MGKRGLLLLGCLWAFFPILAHSQAVLVPGTGITVYPPDDVWKYCSVDGGELVIRFKGAYPWALEQAKGPIFPMDEDEVIDAIKQINFPLDRVIADVLILPLIRIEIRRSSTEGSLVFLSPGTSPYSREHIHYTTVHEIGHVVQHLLMPGEAKHLWKEYLGLRGLEENADNIPPKVLRELFAEDFRMLFGGDLARFNGVSAMKDFESPEKVPGLVEFMLKLSDRGFSGPINVSPNPFSDVVSFDFDHWNLGETRLKIFDAQGRFVTEIGLDPIFKGRASWNGNSSSGEEVAPGVYFVVLDAPNRSLLSKVIKVRR